MGIHDCEAIVLATMDYGESDRIVTFFTRELGKVRAIARHGKASKKRFGAALESFSRVSLSLTVKEGLSHVQRAECVVVYSEIRANLAKIGYAGYACEISDRLLPDRLACPRLFRLLAAYLEHLERFSPTVDDRRFFEANLLNILGYRLPVDRCARCAAPFSREVEACYDTGTGELLCNGCCRTGRRLDGEVLHLLAVALKTGRFGVIRFGVESLPAAGSILDDAIAQHMVRPLNSLVFLRKVLGVCA